MAKAPRNSGAFARWIAARLRWGCGVLIPDPALRALLADFASSLRAILANDLVGLYVVGSFALRGADRHSDCDFIAVVRRRLTAAQETDVRALHEAIPDRDGLWPHNLEGSYARSGQLDRY